MFTEVLPYLILTSISILYTGSIGKNSPLVTLPVFLAFVSNRVTEISSMFLFWKGRRKKNREVKVQWALWTSRVALPVERGGFLSLNFLNQRECAPQEELPFVLLTSNLHKITLKFFNNQLFCSFCYRLFFQRSNIPPEL